jgi:hypothetical protein
VLRGLTIANEFGNLKEETITRAVREARAAMATMEDHPEVCSRIVPDSQRGAKLLSSCHGTEYIKNAAYNTEL